VNAGSNTKASSEQGMIGSAGNLRGVPWTA
jgi:hypothetical protein